MSNIFPVKTATACQFKWSWSTIFLSRKTTTSCHRCKHWEFDLDTISNFHNLPGKILDREKMLDGIWPGNGCEYCRLVEESGGMSERTAWINDKDLVPKEMLINPKATRVTPRLLEVYFTNVCNQACVYCTPQFSSKIEQEYKKFGPIDANPNYYVPPENDDYEAYLEKFWDWMKENSTELYEFQILGGEPLYQKEFEQCLDFFDANPNPNLTWRIFTNLKHDTERFKEKIHKIKQLLETKKIKNFQMICSMDCWGEQGEYVRYGMDLENWKTNFETLLQEKISAHVHMTIMPLTLPTMAEFLQEILNYRKQYDTHIGISSNTVVRPTCLNPYIFGNKFAHLLQNAIDVIDVKGIGSNSVPNHDRQQIDCLRGILTTMNESSLDKDEIKNFYNYLSIMDSRRNTDWKKTFPEIYSICGEILCT
jgi:hypothetical protein